MLVAGDAAGSARAALELDTTVSHSARIWNYWLGGKDNYAVDREAGDKVAAMLPSEGSHTSGLAVKGLLAALLR